MVGVVDVHAAYSPMIQMDSNFKIFMGGGEVMHMYTPYTHLGRCERVVQNGMG